MTEARLPAPPMYAYDPERQGHGFDEEVARLRGQVELSWDVEWRRLQALGVCDGQGILELGCGPGFITRKLAEWLPSSPIVALDADRRMLQTAWEIVRDLRERSRVSFLQASVSATGLASDTFDVAISRYLFQHISDPVAAAAEVRRVLRPGGAHIIIDIDDGMWGMAQPEFPEFRTWHSWRARAQAGRGGNRFLGRRLWHILRDAGYAHIEVDLFACHSDAIGVEAFAPVLAPDQFLPLMEVGLLSFEEYLRACALYQQFLQSPDAFILMVGFIARAEKA